MLFLIKQVKIPETEPDAAMILWNLQGSRYLSLNP
jgi:hypothetical protein